MPPYYDPEREKLFEKIKKAPLKLPKNLSENAKDLIKKVNRILNFYLFLF